MTHALIVDDDVDSAEMLATLLSIATGMLGFVLSVPVLGCAAWHAYRDLVDSAALPLRH